LVAVAIPVELLLLGAAVLVASAAELAAVLAIYLAEAARALPKPL
jgi:hypothetical protein